MKGFKLGLMLMVSVFILAACGTTEDDKSNPEEEQSQEEGSGSEEMEHSDSGEVPTDLKEATNPTYEVGSKAMITTDHMEGMEGAEAQIESSEETTVYMIDYESTTDGEEVKNHKWVTEDELEAE